MIILAGGIWDGGGGGGTPLSLRNSQIGIGTPKIEKGIHRNYTNLYPSSAIYNMCLLLGLHNPILNIVVV